MENIIQEWVGIVNLILEGTEWKGKNLLFICVGKTADGKTVVGFPNDGWVGSLP